jgi:peptidoglycan hydrolase-like protein with peptidoglycan-binding domain
MDVVVRFGARGSHVTEIQKALHKAGFWDLGRFTDYFGDYTDKQVRAFQSSRGLIPDGQVGKVTLGLLNVDKANEPVGKTDKWKGVTIQGSVFPDATIKYDERVRLNTEVVNEYLPEIKKMNLTKGMELLCTVMAYKEGFRKGTRSYRTNNPGNIGNTDSGANVQIKSLKDGIQRQVNYINSVANGMHRAFPQGKTVTIKPFHSAEIAKNQKAYGMSPYLPGYKFTFTGQLDQFVKIYATGARGGNAYLSMILSFFKQNGIDLKPESKIQDIIK